MPPKWELFNQDLQTRLRRHRGSHGIGAVMSSAGFILNLADAGSGAVNLALARGAGTATFVRATTATTVGPTGLVTPVASGIARAYYDPTSLAYRGYLAEGARTNLLLRSEEFDNAYWLTSQMTTTANQTIAPDGNSTADQSLEIATSVTHQVISTLPETILNAAVYTVSVFVKPINRPYFIISDGTGLLGTISFKFADLTTSNSGGGATGTIKAYPNGWYRCTCTSTSTGITSRPSFRSSETGVDAGSQAGDITKGFFIWGAQLEQASFASSYIPTTAAAVTRNADVLTYPLAGNLDNTVGSDYAEVAVGAFSASARVIGTNIASTPISIGGTGLVELFDGLNFFSSAGSIALNVVNKVASKWGGSSATLYRSGIGTSGQFDGSFDATTIHIGTFGGSNPLFGTIRNVRIWQTQLTDAQLQALTT